MDIKEWKKQGSPIQKDPTGIRQRAGSIEKSYYKHVKFQKPDEKLQVERKVDNSNSDLIELKERESRSQMSNVYSSCPRGVKNSMDNIWRKEQGATMTDNRRQVQQINIQNCHISQQHENGMSRKMDFFNQLLQQTSSNIEKISSQLQNIQNQQYM